MSNIPSFSVIQAAKVEAFNIELCQMAYLGLITNGDFTLSTNFNTCATVFSVLQLDLLADVYERQHNKKMLLINEKQLHDSVFKVNKMLMDAATMRDYNPYFPSGSRKEKNEHRLECVAEVAEQLCRNITVVLEANGYDDSGYIATVRMSLGDDVYQMTVHDGRYVDTHNILLNDKGYGAEREIDLYVENALSRLAISKTNKAIAKEEEDCESPW